MTTALTPIGKVVTHMLRGDQAYATKDIEWANPSKPYSGAIYSAEAVESLRKRIEALEAELAKLRDSECEKIMAMSEQQITALTRMQGSNPDDVAKIVKMACDLALKDVAIQRLEAELAACKRDAKPTMFWNNDDPESPYSSIGEFLNDEWQESRLKVGSTRTVQQAIRLPNVTVRVTAVSDDGDIDYIFESADAAIDAAMAAQEQK